MDAQRIVQNCVLKNQSTVIEEMIRANLISEEYLYPFVDDVMEWWLIDSSKHNSVLFVAHPLDFQF